MEKPETEDVLALAAIIREVNGGNHLGAAALAEAILNLSPLCSDPRLQQPVPITDDSLEGIAHEIWACAQLGPDEGITDGVDRIVDVLRREIFHEPENHPS